MSKCVWMVLVVWQLCVDGTCGVAIVCGWYLCVSVCGCYLWCGNCVWMVLVCKCVWMLLNCGVAIVCGWYLYVCVCVL